MTPRRTDATEADTLKTICDFLDLLQNQGKLLYIRHSPSNVVGKKGEITFRRPRASQLGAPDLIVFRRSTYIERAITTGYTEVLCIEVKSSKGVCSKAQIKWSDKARVQGCRYIIARSLEEVTNALK